MTSTFNIIGDKLVENNPYPIPRISAKKVNDAYREACDRYNFFTPKTFLAHPDLIANGDRGGLIEGVDFELKCEYLSPHHEQDTWLPLEREKFQYHPGPYSFHRATAVPLQSKDIDMPKVDEKGQVVASQPAPSDKEGELIAQIKSSVSFAYSEGHISKEALLLCNKLVEQSTPQPSVNGDDLRQKIVDIMVDKINCKTEPFINCDIIAEGFNEAADEIMKHIPRIKESQQDPTGEVPYIGKISLNVTLERFDETEVLKIGDKTFIKKEKVLDMMQRWHDQQIAQSTPDTKQLEGLLEWMRNKGMRPGSDFWHYEREYIGSFTDAQLVSEYIDYLNKEKK